MMNLQNWSIDSVGQPWRAWKSLGKDAVFLFTVGISIHAPRGIFGDDSESEGLQISEPEGHCD
jgi:hypothetical protein